MPDYPGLTGSIANSGFDHLKTSQNPELPESTLQAGFYIYADDYVLQKLERELITAGFSVFWLQFTSQVFKIWIDISLNCVSQNQINRPSSKKLIV
jgi:hypothetical protein